MICDLSAILKDYDGTMPVKGTCALSDTEFLGEDISFPDGLYVNGKITNNTKSLHFTAEVTGKLQAHCARCRKPVCEDVGFSVSEILVRDDDADAGEDDIIVFSGHEIDIGDIVIDNFFLNASGKYLCKEDCRGLCPKCGRDLNIGECNCTDDEIDPRWAALAEIIKNSETE